MTMWRSRWAAVGAAVAVTLGAGGLGLARAAIDTGERPVTVTIEPQRILDTRTNLGLGGRFVNETPRDLQVTGAVPVASGGTATVVPADAVAVVVNVTVVTPDSSGFLSLRPAGATGIPTTSTVNFVSGAIEPNAATVDLGPGGKVQVYVKTAAPAGTADVLVDVVGYTVDHTHDDRYYTQAKVEGLVFDGTIPSGVTVTGNLMWDSHGSADTSSDNMSVAFPGRAPVKLTDDRVNFDQPGVTGDGDPQCTGSTSAPTAPAGKVCIYLWAHNGMATNSLYGGAGIPLDDAGFYVTWTANGTDDIDQYVVASWAYTAP